MRPRVLVTRPEGGAMDICALLDQAGIQPVAVSTIEIDLTGRDGVRDELIARVADADWLVVTSPHGADLAGRRLGASRPAGLRVAAVGPATAATLTARGIDVDVVPEAHRSSAIPDALGAIEGRRVVLARAAGADPELPRRLTDRGARVDEVAIYRVVEGPTSSAGPLRDALRRGLVAVSFTSGSTVRGLVGLASTADWDAVRRLPAFCIGPPTAEVARRCGFHVAAVASPHTAVGLADAITRHFATELP